MRRRTIWLTEFELSQLQEISRRMGQGIDFVIRAAIGTYIANTWQGPKEKEKLDE